MKTTLLCLSFFILLIGCQSTTNDSKYLRSVGDALPDTKLDDPAFKLCNESTAIQYFAFGEKTFKGGKIFIERAFEKHYKPEKVAKESGLIRVRFVVNCRGETGRYRVLGMDEAYQEKEFDNSITDQLLAITKRLKGWKIFPNVDRDYYQYLIFKIKDGELIELMP